MSGGCGGGWWVWGGGWALRGVFEPPAELFEEASVCCMVQGVNQKHQVPSGVCLLLLRSVGPFEGVSAENIKKMLQTGGSSGFEF